MRQLRRIPAEGIRNLKNIAFIVVFMVFSACAAPADIATDYSAAENWAYWDVGSGAADLFLICPTVYISDESFNMPIGDDKQWQRFANALNMQRGIYERD